MDTNLQSYITEIPTMFMFSPSNMQYMVISLFSAYAQLSTFLMMFRTIVNDLIPEPFRAHLQSFLQSMISNLAPEPIRAHLQSLYSNYHQFIPIPSSKTTTIIIEELCGTSHNEVYDAAEVYLRTKVCPIAERFRVGKTAKQNKFITSIQKNQEIRDTFGNFQLTWKFVLGDPNHDDRVTQFSPRPQFSLQPQLGLNPSYLGSPKDDEHNQKKFFELSFDQKFIEKVGVEDYLSYVLATAEKIKNSDKVLKLYTNKVPCNNDDEGLGGVWGSINLNHLASFETLAMDPKKKNEIIHDLERFVKRKDYYKKVGKAWKRGYLLYGPPRTGKSSLVAAMANYLKFDIYDLQLSSVHSNSDLWRFLLSTNKRSIVVIDDIDCIAEMQVKGLVNVQDYDATQMMLTSLLSFIDGLWADARIFVFTTNHKEKLDPALLRPRITDMHIHMSYCTYHGFRILATNYLGIHDDHHHRLFDEIEDLIENVQITPAEITEELMKSEDVDSALNGVLDFLKHKKLERLDDQSEG